MEGGTLFQKNKAKHKGDKAKQTNKTPNERKNRYQQSEKANHWMREEYLPVTCLLKDAYLEFIERS